ncbi:hypothetical protein B0T21DRAFT_36386 [Apiosordaria backusii]|uniref:Uncharacterized protein n=1 Tax=Apiosordaria backusii TaxID=314023 RepID=A0AA40B2Q7_9PEZI|nr:hypothetical protein B0T21DRAFT_36386 [Apiosordaria backusii]
MKDGFTGPGELRRFKIPPIPLPKWRRGGNRCENALLKILHETETRQKNESRKTWGPQIFVFLAACPSSRANILGPSTGPDVNARLFSPLVQMHLRKSQSGSPATIHGSPLGISIRTLHSHPPSPARSIWVESGAGLLAAEKSIPRGPTCHGVDVQSPPSNPGVNMDNHGIFMGIWPKRGLRRERSLPTADVMYLVQAALAAR